jgi:hypothetical protein
MQQNNRELWFAFFTIIGISLVYIYVVISLGSIPAASDFFGHSLGVLGFILMLLTETLYSLRKRSRSARWGRMSSWLKFHIYTGLVGPYLVLLHTSWKFNGLAGIVMLLTVIIVASGVIGRYIYTAVPRTADGIEIESQDIERQIETVNAELQRWQDTRPTSLNGFSSMLASQSEGSGDQLSLIFGRTFQEWTFRYNFWREKMRLNAGARAQMEKMEVLLKRQRTLNRQLSSLTMARQLLGLWHTIHIPIGLVLFTAAFIHIIAAIYYATLLR